MSIEHRELFRAMIHEDDENERAMLRARYIAAIQADARRDARRERSRRGVELRKAAEAVSVAWDAWMESDDDEGQVAVAEAIGALRAALGGQ